MQWLLDQLWNSPKKEWKSNNGSKKIKNTSNWDLQKFIAVYIKDTFEPRYDFLVETKSKF